MRISKPCKFEGLARTWQSYESWKYAQPNDPESKPYAALEKTLGSERIMDVYVDSDPDANLENVNSFRS